MRIHGLTDWMTFPLAGLVLWLALSPAKGELPAPGLTLDGAQGAFTSALPALRSAAEQGDRNAMTLLGQQYEEGMGVPFQLGEAAAWYRRAAELGDAQAQFRLGHFLHHGRGIPQDFTQAVGWYQRAAAQGHPDAQYRLGGMYWHGRGVPRDPAETFFWEVLAATQGHAEAKLQLPITEQQLTDAQFAEVLQRVQAFQPTLEPPPAGTAPRGASPASGTSDPPLALIRQIQEHLRELGYDPGPLDGRMGPRTRQAIQAFQRAMDQAADGNPTPTLAEQLSAQAAERRTFSPPPSSSDPAEAAVPIGNPPAASSPPAAPPANTEPSSTVEPSARVEPSRRSPPAANLTLASTGTGFFVTRMGHLLTNHHVIQDCAVLRVALPETTLTANVHATHPENDLAVIRADIQPRAIASLRRTPPQLGEDVLAAGYPLRNLLGSINVTTGTVSSMSGIMGDARYLQMTAPVQLGSSGGPVLDPSGAIIGMVVAKLDAMAVARATGDIPQNVNFAIKSAVALRFLETQNLPFQEAPQRESPGRVRLAEEVQQYTFLVECWK
jgi:S1-C subfamily serine protease